MVKPSTVVIHSPFGARLMAATGLQSPSWQHSFGYHDTTSPLVPACLCGRAGIGAKTIEAAKSPNRTIRRTCILCSVLFLTRQDVPIREGLRILVVHKLSRLQRPCQPLVHVTLSTALRPPIGRRERNFVSSGRGRGQLWRPRLLPPTSGHLRERWGSHSFRMSACSGTTQLFFGLPTNTIDFLEQKMCGRSRRPQAIRADRACKCCDRGCLTGFLKVQCSSFWVP
jgi:hypothetical protein